MIQETICTGYINVRFNDPVEPTFYVLCDSCQNPITGEIITMGIKIEHKENSKVYTSINFCMKCYLKNQQK